MSFAPPIKVHTHKWGFRDVVNKLKTSEDKKLAAAAELMVHELDDLKKQKCPFCSGYGHAAKDCPTWGRMACMRVTSKHMRSLLDKACKEAKTIVKMGEVKGYSQLKILFKKSTYASNGIEKLLEYKSQGPPLNGH